MDVAPRADTRVDTRTPIRMLLHALRSNQRVPIASSATPSVEADGYSHTPCTGSEPWLELIIPGKAQATNSGASAAS